MNAKAMDAIKMLTEDHREVEELFEQFEKQGDRAKAKKKQLADQICTALLLHAQLEEEIFYPAAREALDDGEDLLDEAVVEHASAKDLIMQVQEMDPEDELYDAKVKVLGEYVNHHVEEEENEMFPKCKKAKMDLGTLGTELEARKSELMEEMAGGIPS